MGPDNQAPAWPRKAVEAIPQAHRHRLLGSLTRGDILDLWRLAGQRYSAPSSQLQTAIHPSYYAPDQFPSQPDQVNPPDPSRAPVSPDETMQIRKPLCASSTMRSARGDCVVHPACGRHSMKYPSLLSIGDTCEHARLHWGPWKICSEDAWVPPTLVRIKF